MKCNVPGDALRDALINAFMTADNIRMMDRAVPPEEKLHPSVHAHVIQSQHH